MSDIREARKTLVRRILEGDGRASPSERLASFNNNGVAVPVSVLIDKVARHPYRIIDEDIAGVRRAGLSEDQIFEIVVCSAVGQATREHDAALAALDAATGKGEHAASHSRQRPRNRYEGAFRAHSNNIAPAGARRHQTGQVPG